MFSVLYRDLEKTKKSMTANSEQSSNVWSQMEQPSTQRNVNFHAQN